MDVSSRTCGSSLCHDQLWPAKAMYGIGSAGASAIANFLPVYFEQCNFSKFDIGVLQTIPSICNILGPPFWGAIADYFQKARLIHILCICSGAILIYFCQFTRSYYTMTLFIFLATFQGTPSQSFLDLAVMHMITNLGGEYGKQRLFGAIGYGIGAYITGSIVAIAGLSWAFNVNLIACLSSIFILRLIPDVSYSNFGDSTMLRGRRPRQPNLIESLSLILQRTDVLFLLCVVFCLAMMYGVISSFLNLYLYNLSGENPRIIGVAVACETISEIPAFFFAHKIIARYGTANVLLMSVAGYAIRITFYAYVRNAWSAIPFQLLHGVTFGFSWAACTQYVYTASPKGCESTMMGMLNAVQNGLGHGAGSLIGGYLYEHLGARKMWLVVDMGVPLSVMGIILFAHSKHRRDSMELRQMLINKQQQIPDISSYSSFD